jgi:hypothetical protein
MRARRIVSEHRGTACRANCASCRAPVSAKGSPNSSPDSSRWVLRAALDSYTSELKPQSTVEHRVVESRTTQGDRPSAIAGLERTVLSDRAEAEIAEKLNINERTPELIENKLPFFGRPQKRIRRNRSNPILRGHHLYKS